MTQEKKELEDELLAARAEIVDLQARTKTTLTSSQFLVLLLFSPMVIIFCILGCVIVIKTTQNPELVAPHLDLVLVSFSIFSLPVSSGIGVVVGLMADEIKGRAKE